MSCRFIQQLTVYADVRAASQLDFIRSCAQRVCPNNFTVVPVSSLVTPAGSSLAFMKLWEHERGDTVRAVRNDVLFFHQFECFITAGQTATSGEVAYALYRRQMPVLSLNTTPEGAPCRLSPPTSIPSPRQSQQQLPEQSSLQLPSRQDHQQTCMPPTAIQRLLYHERRPENSVEEAIDAFLTFPERPGKMLALETDCEVIMGARVEGGDSLASAPPSASATFRNVCDALRHEHELGSPHEEGGHMIFLGPDGYPLQPLTSMPAACIASGCRGYPFGAVGAAANWMLPPPASVFGHLQTLLCGSSGKGEPGRCFYELLQQSPQLYGALAAFNRYENRGMMRCLLHRGFWLVVLGHSSRAAAELAKVTLSTVSAAKHTASHHHYHTHSNDHASCKRHDRATAGEVGEGRGNVTKELATACAANFNRHLQSLNQFEGHWMEMAMPQHTVCLTSHLSSSACREESGSGGDSAAKRDGTGWVTLMPRVESSEHRPMVKGPGGDTWDVVPVPRGAMPQTVAKRVAAIFLDYQRSATVAARPPITNAKALVSPFPSSRLPLPT